MESITYNLKKNKPVGTNNKPNTTLASSMKNISNLHSNQSFSSLFSQLNRIRIGQEFGRAWRFLVEPVYVIIRVVNAQVLGSVARTEKITNRSLILTGGLEPTMNRGRISFLRFWGLSSSTRDYQNFKYDRFKNTNANETSYSFAYKGC